MNKKKIFISYRSLDSQIARNLSKCIESIGASVYLDERDPELETIQVSSTLEKNSLMKTIFDGLRSSDVLVAIITRRTRGSWWVPAEVSVALELGKQVVFVCEQGVRPPDFDISIIIDNKASLIEWLLSFAGQSLDFNAIKSVEAALFLDKVNDVRVASLNAIRRIEALWDPQSWTELQLDKLSYAYQRLWMGCNSQRLISTLYSISAPIYLYRRNAPRLDRSELEREIAGLLFDSWTDEESLAAISPTILYEARKCTDWRGLRDKNPQRYWLQGMKPKDIDLLFHEMTTNNNELIRENDFTNLFKKRFFEAGSLQKPLGLAANALQGFTIYNRPVFCRVMMVKYACIMHYLGLMTLVELQPNYP